MENSIIYVECFRDASFREQRKEVKCQQTKCSNQKCRGHQQKEEVWQLIMQIKHGHMSAKISNYLETILIEIIQKLKIVF